MVFGAGPELAFSVQNILITCVHRVEAQAQVQVCPVRFPHQLFSENQLPKFIPRVYYINLIRDSILNYLGTTETFHYTCWWREIETFLLRSIPHSTYPCGRSPGAYFFRTIYCEDELPFGVYDSCAMSDVVNQILRNFNLLRRATSEGLSAKSFFYPSQLPSSNPSCWLVDPSEEWSTKSLMTRNVIRRS